jgi:hypothetical protein
MSKWFEILKPGTFKDTAGRDHTFTLNRLKEIERKFNEQTNEAPLVVGHPEMNSPAFGWAQKLKLVGDRLKALPHQIVPEFAEAVNKGIYKYVSVSLRPDDSLRHIGFLGGMPPAVKGLAPVMFAEEPEITIDFANGELDLADAFANNKIRALGGIIQRIRDWLIQKDGVEAADKIIGQWEVDWLKEDPPPDKDAAVSAPGGFSEAQTTPVRGKEDTTMEVKKTETPAAAGVMIQAAPIGEFAERVATLETQNAKLLEDNKKLQREKIESSVRNFVEGLAGKILPKHKRAVTEILMSLQEGGLEINFSEGPEKKPAAQLMRDFLEELPAQIPIKPSADGATGKNETSGEFSEVETDPERLDLHNRAKALEAKEKIPYAEAVSRLMKGGK